jgi:hypothetical protein
MPIRFENNYTKKWLAHRGPARVFGMDVDAREGLSDDEAIKWFDRVWEATLQRAVEQASPCDVGFVRTKLPQYAQSFIDAKARHREFTLDSCFFICQLADDQTCDQLWFVPSVSPDPRALYIRFKTVPTKDAFDELAKHLGWGKPRELAEKLILDFMESVTRKNYRSAPAEPDDPGETE